MSRINDALKRASRAHRSRPSATPDTASLRPAPSPVPPSGAGRPAALRVAIPVVGVAVLGFALWAAWEWRLMSRRFEEFSERDTKIVLPPRPPPLPVTSRTVPVSSQTENADPVTARPPDADAPVARPEPPHFPDLKLQGVFFSRTSPSVLINGKNRGLGETINGVRIVRIEQQKVTVEWQGQTRILSINPY